MFRAVELIGFGHIHMAQLSLAMAWLCVSVWLRVKPSRNKQLVINRCFMNNCLSVILAAERLIMGFLQGKSLVAAFTCFC